MLQGLGSGVMYPDQSLIGDIGGFVEFDLFALISRGACVGFAGHCIKE
jgi:hypothetical protein